MCTVTACHGTSAWQCVIQNIDNSACKAAESGVAVVRAVTMEALQAAYSLAHDLQPHRTDGDRVAALGCHRCPRAPISRTVRSKRTFAPRSSFISNVFLRPIGFAGWRDVLTTAPCFGSKKFAAATKSPKAEAAVKKVGRAGQKRSTPTQASSPRRTVFRDEDSSDSSSDDDLAEFGAMPQFDVYSCCSCAYPYHSSLVCLRAHWQAL